MTTSAANSSSATARGTAGVLAYRTRQRRLGDHKRPKGARAPKAGRRRRTAERTTVRGDEPSTYAVVIGLPAKPGRRFPPVHAGGEAAGLLSKEQPVSACCGCKLPDSEPDPRTGPTRPPAYRTRGPCRPGTCFQRSSGMQSRHPPTTVWGTVLLEAARSRPPHLCIAGHTLGSSILHLCEEAAVTRLRNG